MAAAALMSPASAYHPHNPSFPPPYSHPSPAPMPGILNQGDSSRRTSKDSEPSQRQSLPSISEMFSAKPAAYSPTTPTTAAGPSSLPPPPPSYSNAPPSRLEPGPESRPPPPVFPQRPEAGGPGPAYQYGDQREPIKPAEHPQRNGIFSAPHAAPAPYPAPGQLPPGQLPLSQAPPISPRHLGPPMPPPYDPQRPPMPGDDEYAIQRRYDPNSLNRHFEVWGYTDCLERIMWASRTVFNFAEAYANIASEQHGGQPIPQRLPTDKEVSEMLNNADYLRKNLESIREVVHHSIANEKAREGGKHRGTYDDDDVSLYGDGMKQHYGLGEVKKRRGRAAPPGRCHSCNRIDTPEWRRGPDGARTLCNACGLHYAKLERKRQMEQRSMRPKAAE
ncbi:putative GATA-type domain-containing protein [Seiridium unicorne]|uniref:GATA-type domain-containing protein n=1 Tax=Seiridium unicorne TaxID=138068 RepID=A0ABR2V3L9_9PEZI